MSPEVEQQKQHDAASAIGKQDTVGKGVFTSIINEVPLSSQDEADEHDLVGLTANLELDDPDNKHASQAMDENSDPKLKTATTDPMVTSESTETIELDQSAADASLEYDDLAANLDDAKSKSGQDQSTTAANIGDNASTIILNDTDSNSEQNAQPDSPRLQTYIRLHNDMMTSKTALTSHATEQAELYNRASHLARTLLTSHEKHDDLPLVMHAHACLVLGCSDEDDCYERMKEALKLVRHAIEVGAVERLEGEAMIKTCEMVMDAREDATAAEHEGESDGSESEAEDDSDTESAKIGDGMGKGTAGGGDHLEASDALP